MGDHSGLPLPSVYSLRESYADTKVRCAAGRPYAGLRVSHKRKSLT